MLKVVEVFVKIAPNGMRIADHCYAPGTKRVSAGFRIAEFNQKNERLRFLFPSMLPYTTKELAEQKLASLSA